MSSEPHVDPRGRPLAPTQEEVDAWATREHRRRAAWLAGPDEEERRDWTRRYRWRATLGLEESRLAPAPEDVELWAAREHKRRQAWLAGPTPAEKHDWARAQRRHARAQEDDSPAEPTAEEIDAWAAREQQRRQQWLDGPAENEKQEWARQQTAGVFPELLSLPDMLRTELPEAAEAFLREAELAGKGAFSALAQGPRRLWSYLVRAGKDVEDDFYQPPRRRRVPY